MRVLILALAVVLGLSACGGGTPPSPAKPATSPQPAAAKAAAPPPAPAPAPTPYVYETKGRRDPFRPLIEPKKVEVAVTRARPLTEREALQVNELKLAGIIWEQRGFFALVEAPNGKGYVLRVNDTIGEGARVAKITAEGVTFEVKGATTSPRAQVRVVELRLRKEE